MDNAYVVRTVIVVEASLDNGQAVLDAPQFASLAPAPAPLVGYVVTARPAALGDTVGLFGSQARGEAAVDWRAFDALRLGYGRG